MIGFGLENEEIKQFAPYLLECNEVITDGYDNALRMVIEIFGGKKYEIIINNYLMHLVRNESYTFRDDYEIRKGRYLFIYEKSRFIDYFDNVMLHTPDHSFPSMGNHYEICTENYIIDVIASSDSIPTIREL